LHRQKKTLPYNHGVLAEGARYTVSLKAIISLPG
jgi:hypothetical protein